MEGGVLGGKSRLGIKLGCVIGNLNLVGKIKGVK